LFILGADAPMIGHIGALAHRRPV